MSIKFILVFSLLTMMLMAMGEAVAEIKLEFDNPSRANYSNVVSVRNGGIKTLYISGQVGFLNGELPSEFSKQVENAFENLVLQLKSAGASLTDIVKINIYIVNLDNEKYKALNTARNRYFTQPNMPASALVGIQTLIFNELKVEIDAIAVLKND